MRKLVIAMFTATLLFSTGVINSLPALAASATDGAGSNSGFGSGGGGSFGNSSTSTGGGCSKASSFFGLPTWYANLPTQLSKDGNSCAVVLTDPSDVWIIVINVVNILLRLTGIVAVVFIVIGGIRYITSQGESAGITAAKQTITRAIVGLVITILSVLIITYISSVFGQKVQQTNKSVNISAAWETRDA